MRFSKTTAASGDREHQQHCSPVPFALCRHLTPKNAAGFPPPPCKTLFLPLSSPSHICHSLLFPSILWCFCTGQPVWFYSLILLSGHCCSSGSASLAVPESHLFLVWPSENSSTCLGKVLTSCPAAESPSAIFHHMAPHPPTLSHGKYQDNQTCLPMIHVTICLGFPLLECSDTHPASQNISGLLLSKFLNLNKHERPNSALGSICTNPICDIKWGCLNRCEHGV